MINKALKYMDGLNFHNDRGDVFYVSSAFKVQVTSFNNVFV